MSHRELWATCRTYDQLHFQPIPLQPVAKMEEKSIDEPPQAPDHAEPPVNAEPTRTRSTIITFSSFSDGNNYEGG